MTFSLSLYQTRIYECLPFFLVGRPRLNRDIPSEKPKPTQAMLKQNNEILKIAAQNIVPASEVPPVSGNEIITVSTSCEPSTSTAVAVPVPSVIAPPPPDNNGNKLNVSNTQEVTTSESNPSAEVKISQANVVLPISTVTTITTTPPPKVIQPTSQFVQVKPPTTSGRVQSPTVKNFFIRKGPEKLKQAQSQIAAGTFITSTPGVSPPQMTISQLPANKKIIIKSQQIIVPANNAKPNQSGSIIQVSAQSPIQSNVVQTVNSTSQATIPINTSIIETSPSQTSASDLSGILDLPILFADNNDTSVIDQTAQIINTSSPSSSIQLLNTSTDRNVSIASPQNIFITTADGKSVIPNRPVVITTAKVQKPTVQTSVSTPPSGNKVIFINRNLNKHIVGSQAVPIGVKGLQTLKLMPTSMPTSTQSTPMTLQSNQTKIPGNKINLSALKLVKNPTANVTGNIKPLIINKAMPGAKNAIVIKSPMGANVKTPATIIKAGNVLNRNITVKKVMNMIKPITSPPNASSTITSVSVASSAVITSPVASPIATIALSPVINSSPQSVAQLNTSTVTMVQTSLVVTPSTSSSSLPAKTTRKTRNSN